MRFGGLGENNQFVSISIFSTQEPKIVVAQDFHLSWSIASKRLSRSSVLGIRECALICWRCVRMVLCLVWRGPYKLGLQLIPQCCPLLRGHSFFCLSVHWSCHCSLYPQSGGNEYIYVTFLMLRFPTTAYWLSAHVVNLAISQGHSSLIHKWWRDELSLHSLKTDPPVTSRCCKQNNL